MTAKVGIDAGERSLATDTSGNGSWWTWSWTWDTTRWANGWHHIVAVAYDNSSLAADTSIVVLVENPLDEAPHVVITAPDDGATVSGIVKTAWANPWAKVSPSARATGST